MTMVRFASLCDDCDKRSEEYTEWNTCRECLRHICPDCAVPGSEKEHSRDRSHGDYTEAEEWETVLCKACREAEEAVA